MEERDEPKTNQPSVIFFLFLFLGNKAMTFDGESYIRYRLKESFDEPSRSISLALRTSQPQGTLVFAAGQYDYSILEVCSRLIPF